MANGGGGNSGGGNQTNQELQPHPVKEQLPGIQYCVNSPPPWRMFFNFILSNFGFYLIYISNLCFFVLTHYFDVAVEAVVLGFQHYLLTLGITVLIPSILVPLMGGGYVSIYI